MRAIGWILFAACCYLAVKGHSAQAAAASRVPGCWRTSGAAMIRPKAGATHALVWVPCTSGWELWGAAADHEYEFPDFPRNTDSATLAAWVSTQVGYPVTLVPGNRLVRAILDLRPHWPIEPEYYVIPAGRS